MKGSCIKSTYLGRKAKLICKAKIRERIVFKRSLKSNTGVHQLNQLNLSTKRLLLLDTLSCEYLLVVIHIFLHKRTTATKFCKSGEASMIMSSWKQVGGEII